MGFFPRVGSAVDRAREKSVICVAVTSVSKKVRFFLIELFRLRAGASKKRLIRSLYLVSCVVRGRLVFFVNEVNSLL